MGMPGISSTYPFFHFVWFNLILEGPFPGRPFIPVVRMKKHYQTPQQVVSSLSSMSSLLVNSQEEKTPIEENPDFPLDVKAEKRGWDVEW